MQPVCRVTHLQWRSRIRILDWVYLTCSEVDVFCLSSIVSIVYNDHLALILIHSSSSSCNDNPLSQCNRSIVNGKVACMSGHRAFRIVYALARNSVNRITKLQEISTLLLPHSSCCLYLLLLGSIERVSNQPP